MQIRVTINGHSSAVETLSTGYCVAYNGACRSSVPRRWGNRLCERRPLPLAEKDEPSSAPSFRYIRLRVSGRTVRTKPPKHFTLQFEPPAAAGLFSFPLDSIFAYANAHIGARRKSNAKSVVVRSNTASSRPSVAGPREHWRQGH